MRINHFQESLFLLTTSALLTLVLYSFTNPFQKPRQAVLVVQNMCCEQRAGDAATELRKVPGVTATKHSLAAGEILVTVSGSAPVLHCSLWDAAKTARVRPVKLIVDGRVIADRNEK